MKNMKKKPHIINSTKHIWKKEADEWLQLPANNFFNQQSLCFTVEDIYVFRDTEGSIIGQF